MVFRLRRRLGYDLHHFEYQPKPFFSPGIFLQKLSQEKRFILDFAINEIFIFLSLRYFKLENLLAQGFWEVLTVSCFVGTKDLFEVLIQIQLWETHCTRLWLSKHCQSNLILTMTKVLRDHGYSIYEILPKSSKHK